MNFDRSAVSSKIINECDQEIPQSQTADIVKKEGKDRESIRRIAENGFAPPH